MQRFVHKRIIRVKSRKTWRHCCYHSLWLSCATPSFLTRSNKPLLQIEPTKRPCKRRRTTMFKGTIRPLFMLSPPSLGPDSRESRHQVTKSCKRKLTRFLLATFFALQRVVWRKVCGGGRVGWFGGGKRFSAKKPHFPWRETDLQKILPPSRRGKPFFERFFPFPAAGNRFSSVFFHFPRREGVFRRFFPISRGGKAFFERFDRFRAAGRRFSKSEIGFAFQFGVSWNWRSTSCFGLAFG